MPDPVRVTISLPLADAHRELISAASDRVVAAVDGSDNASFYTYDGLGSTTDLTNDAGNVTDTYSYDVFGAVSHDSGTSDNYFLFAGEQTDAATGFQYLRNRYYDSEVGRFLTRDPMPAQPTNPQTLNQYAYALNNPVNRVDPMGLASEGSGSSFLPPLQCISFALLLAGLASFAIASPLAGLALFTAAITIDLYADDFAGATFDTGASAGTILIQIGARRIALHLFVLDLAYTGGGCVSQLRVK